VAEGHAAIHATGSLLAQALVVHVFMELIPVFDAFQGATVERKRARVF
jgi:hypothetical protein